MSFPLKNIHFMRGTWSPCPLVAFVCLCTCQERFALLSAGKKGYVWNISLPFCLSLHPYPSFVKPGGVQHLGLFEQKKAPTAILLPWCGHTLPVSVTLISSSCSFFLFFFTVYNFSFNNSLFVVFSQKVKVNLEMTWRAHCLVIVFCAITWNQQDNSRTLRDKASNPLADWPTE